MKKIFFTIVYSFLFATSTLASEFQLFTTVQQQKALSAQDDGIGSYISTSNQLKQIEVGDTIFGIENYKIIVNSRQVHSNGDVTLFGKIDDTNYRAIITRGENGTFARIHTEGGVYNIKMTANGEKLFTPEDNSLFSKIPIDDGGVIPIETIEQAQKKTSLNSIGQTNIRAAQLSTAQLTSSSDTSTTTIDIMVFWDLDFQNYRVNPLTSLNQLISLTNSDFVASNIYIRLNLVYGALKDFSLADYQTNKVMLNALHDNDSSYGFGDVNTLRAQYKADLVGYLRRTNILQGDNCGIAYQLGANGAMPNYYRSSAFFVVSEGDDINNSVSCGDEAFPHEVGHNLGSTHDRANYDNSPTIFPYSFGYGNTETNSDFGTIMSYTQKQTYLFSNPNIDCDLRSGVTNGTPPNIPCGITGYADNAKGFNAVRNDVAGFDTETSTGASSGGGCALASNSTGLDLTFYLLMIAAVLGLLRHRQKAATA